MVDGGSFVTWYDSVAITTSSYAASIKMSTSAEQGSYDASNLLESIPCVSAHFNVALSYAGWLKWCVL
jgi:hypothetical protein